MLWWPRAGDWTLNSKNSPPPHLSLSALLSLSRSPSLSLSALLSFSLSLSLSQCITLSLALPLFLSVHYSLSLALPLSLSQCITLSLALPAPLCSGRCAQFSFPHVNCAALDVWKKKERKKKSKRLCQRFPPVSVRLLVTHGDCMTAGTRGEVHLADHGALLRHGGCLKELALSKHVSSNRQKRSKHNLENQVFFF